MAARGGHVDAVIDDGLLGVVPFDGEGEASHLAATAEEPRALDARGAGADGFGVELLGDDGLGEVGREGLEVAREVGPAFGGGGVDDEALLGELTFELVFPDSILEVNVVTIEGVGEDGDFGGGMSTPSS